MSTELDPKIIAFLAEIGWQNFDKETRTMYLCEVRKIEEARIAKERKDAFGREIRRTKNVIQATRVFLKFIGEPKSLGEIHCGLEEFGLNYATATIRQALNPHERMHAGIRMHGGRGRSTFYSVPK